MASSNTFESEITFADERVETRIRNRKKSISDRDLLIAADSGNVTNVSELIESGADCNFVDKDGNTALFYAIESSANEDEKLKVLELLLLKGASINVENADCKSTLDLANKSKAKKIITLIENQIVNNSYKALEKILEQQQKHSRAYIEENLPEQKNNYNRIAEKVKKKVKVCLDALESLTISREKVESFTYENANVCLLFLEAFALQDFEIKNEHKTKLINSFFGKEDNEVIKSVRNVFMHRDKQKVVIELDYLKKIVSFYEESKIFRFFCELKDYVQWVYDKFCKKPNIDVKKLPIAMKPVSNAGDIASGSEVAEISVKEENEALLNRLHSLVKEANSVKQDRAKQEEVMFNLIVNIIPLLETDLKDGDLKSLKSLRDELVHNFHKYETNLDIRLMELMKSLYELSPTLLAYYYAQRVFGVLKSIEPCVESKEIDNKFDKELKDLSKKGIFGYDCSKTLFQGVYDDIKKMVDQYLKFMVIIDGTKIQTEDELGEEGKVIEKKTYILLSGVKRRYIFEKFLMLRTIKDLKHEEYYQEQKEELIQELSDYGIDNDTVNSVCETYVQNNKDLDTDFDEFKNDVTSTVEALKSFRDKIPSVQDVISLYRSKDIDKLSVDTRLKKNIKDVLDGLPKDRKEKIQVNEDEFRVGISEIVINIFQTFYNPHNKYQLKFTNEYAFNDKTFLNFLTSKSTERDSGNSRKFHVVGCVKKSVKKLLNIGYSAPYIVRLIVKADSSDLMEKDDLKKLIEALLKKEGLYADHLNDLLSVEKRSKEIDLYKIVCEKVIGKNLMFEKMRAVLKSPKHVKNIVNELIKKANQPENRDKAAELTKEIVKVTNSISCELHGIGKYDDALKMLFDKNKMTKSNLIEKEDIHLLWSQYIRARIQNQQGIEEENIKTKKKFHEAAEKTFHFLKDRINDIEDHNQPYRILILAERVHTLHLLKKYDQAHDACTDLYKEIRNYVLGLPVDLSLENSEDEYHKIFKSKKYQKLLTFSDEAQKYVDIVNIKSRQAYIQSEQGKFRDALPVFKEVYIYRKGIKDSNLIQSMRNIAYTCAKLGWEEHKNDKDFASQYYHEGLLMRNKVFEMKSKKSFSFTSNTIDLKNVILSLLDIAKLKHHYDKKNNDLNYYKKADGNYQKILAIEKAVFGDRDECTLKTKHDFAVLKNDFGSQYIKLSNVEEAEKCLEEALKLFIELYEIRRINQGEEHEDTWFSRKDIAFTHNKLGQVTRSSSHYEKALEIYDFLSKKEWKSKNQCQSLFENTKRQFAKLKNNIGLHDEALKLFNEVYEIRRINLGEEHEDTLGARKDIAFTHNKLGQVTRSSSHYEKALEIYDFLSKKEWKYKDKSQSLFETTKRQFAILKNDIGLHDEALKLFNEVYESRRINLGEEHEDTLFARKDIAFTHNELGRAKSSSDHYEKALAIYDFLRKEQWKCKNQCQNLYEKSQRWRQGIKRKLPSEEYVNTKRKKQKF